METRQAGQTNLHLSVLGLGTMTMGWSSNERTSFDIMDKALAEGINFLDTADIYSTWVPGNPGGVSETIIGDWMGKRKNRHRIILATKVRGKMWPGPDGEGLSRAHILRAVDDSLRRLQTDYIDLYQTHWPDDDTPMDETLETLTELVKAGKVRYIGASNYSAQQLTANLQTSANRGFARFQTLQPHYSLVYRREFEAQLQTLCRDEQIGVVPYSPLAGGFLTGKYTREKGAPADSRGAGNDRMARYSNDAGFAVIHALHQMAPRYNATPAQLSLAWMLANPVITSPIIGARTVDQLSQLLPATTIKLIPEDMTTLNQLSAAMP